MKYGFILAFTLGALKIIHDYLPYDENWKLRFSQN